jgi:hypothetical protein
VRADAPWSVIVPVGPGDTAWQELLPELAALPEGSEVLLVAARKADIAPTGKTRRRSAPVPARWLQATRGRACQLNAGVRAARNPRLWFLHADSRLAAETLPALASASARAPDALGCFDLRFLDDGPPLMWLNMLGACMRSRVLGLPFGDQGFFIARSLLTQLGGFDERLAFGEDHALVWAARRAGVPLVHAGAPLYTSARKYAEQGWLGTTALHVWLTAQQALAELLRGWRAVRP